MKATACGLALLLVVSCRDRAGDEATAQEAIEVTNRFWATNLPQVNVRDLTVTVKDLNSSWRITYDIPEGSAGAQWKFYVDKRSREIVHVKGGQ